MATRPIHEIRKGLIKVRVWRKRTRSGLRHTVSVARLSRNGDAWKSFRNIPSVHLVTPNELNTYDILVSIVMIEAVGYPYLETFFKACARLLKPDGMMALQAITIADQAFDRHRRRQLGRHEQPHFPLHAGLQPQARQHLDQRPRVQFLS